MQLSENFSLKEMCVSRDYPELAKIQYSLLINADCYDEHEIIGRNLERVANELLQPIRDYLKEPVIVLSGYRCEELNRLVGGSELSQHKKGEAVDFTFRGATWDLFEDIKNKKINLKWHQLIFYPEMGFIHISLPTNKNDMQVIVK